MEARSVLFCRLFVWWGDCVLLRGPVGDAASSGLVARSRAAAPGLRPAPARCGTLARRPTDGGRLRAKSSARVRPRVRRARRGGPFSEVRASLRQRHMHIQVLDPPRDRPCPSTAANLKGMQWFRDLNHDAAGRGHRGAFAIATALITAVGTAINIWLKDWLDSRARSKVKRALRRESYRKYADPLTAAAESLFWRLHEIYASDRGDYLHRGRGLTRYEQHKASSTRYRIAALLGWMVALRRGERAVKRTA